MSYTHHTKCAAAEFGAESCYKSRYDILRHSRSVASRSIGNLYTRAPAPFRVNVVKAYRGRSHEAAASAFEQRRVATRSRSRHQRIGISHRRAVNLFGGKLRHFHSCARKGVGYERHITFHYNFQIHIFHIYSAVQTPKSENTQI